MRHALPVSSGRDCWRFDCGGSYGSDLSTAPLVLRDGGVIWPGPRHRVFGLGPSGRLRWTLPREADLLTPVLDRIAATLVVADQGGENSGYRLPPGGGRPQLRWSRRLAGSSYGNPAVAADGTIYETGGDALVALTPAGRLLWTVKTPASIEVSPAVADGGIVVFGSNDCNEHGVDDSGRRLARDLAQGRLWTSAAVDVVGTPTSPAAPGRSSASTPPAGASLTSESGARLTAIRLAPDGAFADRVRQRSPLRAAVRIGSVGLTVHPEPAFLDSMDRLVQ